MTPVSPSRGQGDHSYNSDSVASLRRVNVAFGLLRLPTMPGVGGNPGVVEEEDGGEGKWVIRGPCGDIALVFLLLPLK